MEDKNLTFAQKTFVNIVDNTANPGPLDKVTTGSIGIVKSVNEFMDLLIEANDAYNVVHNILDRDRIVFAEDSPGELLFKLNNETTTTEITELTLEDIRVVTYMAEEIPGTLSQRKINDNGIQQIKWKLAGYYDDPEYTGYSILRYSKDIEATVTFKVWGKFFQDIRKRAALLKDVIDNNIWFFKYKGLRDIIWLSSLEGDTWDNKLLAKYKTEKYMIRFSEIKEIREKNLEQVVVQLGLQ